MFANWPTAAPLEVVAAAVVVGEAEVAGFVADVVVVGVGVGVVTGAAAEVVGATAAELEGPVAAAPLLAEVACPMQVVDPALMLKAADWATKPVLSRRVKPTEVPAGISVRHV
jgi:hypothetical protein